jgi:hypothetical protein
MVDNVPKKAETYRERFGKWLRKEEKMTDFQKLAFLSDLLRKQSGY